MNNMPNSILKLLLKNKEERGLLGELSLDLYEMKLVAYPMVGLKDWLKFSQLRNVFNG